MKVYETLEADLPHPEHPEVVFTIKRPDVIMRTELMESMLLLADPEKVKADLRGAVDGKPTRVQLSTVISNKATDDAFFGLDPEGKASPAPQIDS